MAWELMKVEDQRKELVQAYLEGRMSMTELCKLYKVSRKTAYKWCNRYLNHGTEETFKDLSRARHSSSTIYGDELIELMINLKLKRRKRGPKKILWELEKIYPDIVWPSKTRVYEIFKEHHLVKPKRLRRRVPATHPLGEMIKCNDVWSVDFKGWFLTKNLEKCEPLTIIDGYSRYLIRCLHLAKKSADNVWPVFEEAFLEYGLPNRIRSDNGPPFATVGVGRLSDLSIKLIKAGAVPEWINPGHPEENGRHERFHLTLSELIADPPAETLKEQIELMAAFEEEYNFDRPHESLGMNTPGSHYCVSTRRWDGILRGPEYDTKEMLTRKVCQSGCIWLSGKEYYLGQTLTGEYVGLKEDELGKLQLYYGPVYLGALNLDKGLEKPKLKAKKIVRRG